MEQIKIQNIDNYDPRKLRTDVLKDDFRIALAWLSAIHSGKKFMYPEAKVFDTLKKITSELIIRGIHFHPSDMKLISRRNFFRVIKSLNPRLLNYPKINDLDKFQYLTTKESVRKGLYFLSHNHKAFALVFIKEDSIPRPIESIERYIEKTGVPKKIFLKQFGNKSKIFYLTKFNYISKFENVKLIQDGDILKHEKTDDVNSEIEAFLLGFDVENEVEEFVQKLLPIRPNNDEADQDPIKINDVLKFINDDFHIREEVVSLTGSIVYNGETKHDIDFFIKATENEKIYIPIIFRIFRALPDNMRKRVQFIPNKYEGPFSDYLPLYDLDCVLNQDYVSSDAEKSIQKAAIRSNNPKILAMAKDSLREDRIEPGRFFLPLKTSVNSINAYREGEVYNADALIEYLKKIGKGNIPEIAIQKKYD